MSAPVKRPNPSNQTFEDIPIKRPPVKGAAIVSETLSASPPPSPKQGSLLKRSISVIDQEQDDLVTAESKTQSVVAQTLSSPAPAAAEPVSTPPSKHRRRVSFSQSPASEKGSPQAKETKLSIKAHELARSRIENSKVERRNKLQSLAPELRPPIETLEADLLAMKDLVLAGWVLDKELNRKNSQLIDLQGISPTKDEKEQIEEGISKLEQEVETYEEQIKSHEKNLAKQIDKLLEKFKELTKADFSCFTRSITTNEDNLALLWDMLLEQVLNKWINRLLFLRRVENDIRKHLTKIIQEFYRRDFDLNCLPEITFKLILSGSETHNLGKVATKIEFFQKDQPLFDVYYKPRDARIDIAVINLFKEINRLSGNQKSSSIPLPEYNILCFDNAPEFFSVWEYIKGKSYEGEADVAIGSLKLGKKINSNQEATLRDKLLRLESLCHAIHLSDLHSENILFRNIDTQNPEIIPIDLESIQEDAQTGLYSGRAPATHLSQDESTLVNKFRSIVNCTPFRLVPLATGEFLGCLYEPTFYERVADALIKSLENRDYKLACPKEEILRLVVDDYLNHDIPYLIKYEDSLFYGPLRLQKKIAVKIKQEKK